MSPIDAYLDALQAGDLETMLGLFADDATVVSPLRGPVDPEPFYDDLFAKTARSETTVRHRFEGDRHAAVHFDYRWVLDDGSETTFECVDIFDLDDDGKIQELRIVYDAGRVMEELG